VVAAAAAWSHVWLGMHSPATAEWKSKGASFTGLDDIVWKSPSCCRHPLRWTDDDLQHRISDIHIFADADTPHQLAYATRQAYMAEQLVRGR
jgi:hypothetical protein